MEDKIIIVCWNPKPDKYVAEQKIKKTIILNAQILKEYARLSCHVRPTINYLFLLFSSSSRIECNYSVHVRTVQLKSKSYLQLKTGWSIIYIWDYTGRVMDPIPAWNWPIALAWSTSGGMLFQVMMVRGKKEKRYTSARVLWYLVLSAATSSSTIRWYE